MKDIIIVDLQEYHSWKIQLTIAINLISSKDVKEKHAMYLMSENIKFKSCYIVNDIVDELLKTFLSRYKNNLKVSMRIINFIFDSVQLLHYINVTE